MPHQAGGDLPVVIRRLPARNATEFGRQRVADPDGDDIIERLFDLPEHFPVRGIFGQPEFPRQAAQRQHGGLAVEPDDHRGDGVAFAQAKHRLAEQAESPDVHVILVKDGEHRLSRPADLALLRRTVGALLGQDGA